MLTNFSKRIIPIVLLPLIVLTACSAISAKELEYIDPGKYSYIKSEVIPLGDGYTIHDFVVTKDNIIATDRKNHCLLVIDRDSGEIRAVGQKGSGNEDFCDPTGIWLKDDLFYVVDSGNMRIKILNRDLSYKESIDLSSVVFWAAGSSFFNDISVDDNGNIFITVHTSVRNEGILYCIESGSDNKPKVLMKNFMGIVTSYKDKTYCADTMEFTGRRQASSGKNYIYEIEECKYVNAYELPYNTLAMGIYAGDEGMYLSSRSYSNIQKADLNALTTTVIFSEQTKTSDIPDFNKYVPERDYGAIALENNTVWLYEAEHNEIYKLKEE